MRREYLMVALALVGCSRLGTDPTWSERRTDGTGSADARDSNGSTNTPETLGQATQPTRSPGANSSAPNSPQTNGSEENGAPTSAAAAPNGNSGTGEPGSADDSGSSDGDSTTPTTKPGRLPIHHLTATEYNTTVAELLHTNARPADYFPASGSSEFDTNVGVLTSLSPVLVQGYYGAAKDLSAALLADPAALSGVLDCDPASASPDGEEQCVRTLIAGFGLRAFRRPLPTDETDHYWKSYQYARTELGFDASAATAHLIRILLSSPNFFLRIEAPLDDQDTTQGKAFALASRLSYLLWSSGPDAELFESAAQGELATSDDILREANRMLDDQRSGALIRDFVGQWLGLRRLASHDVSTSVFSEWQSEWLGAMATQADEYVSGFFTGERDWSEFLSASVPEVPEFNDFLAADPEPRAGFLTLPAFLTLSSHSDRTSPTTRAVTILSGLLCTTITPPANVAIPDLSATGDGELGEANIRKRLEQHRAASECASCHAVLDPIGLSLEHYDAIGRYRTQYGDGSAVDASGEYAGVSFSDVNELVPTITSDERFARCPVEKLTSYALRKRVTDDDKDTLDAITKDWASGSLDDLLRRIVSHPMFSPQL